MDKGTNDTRTITAPTLSELMDKLEAATPPGKVAIVGQIIPSIDDGGVWIVEYYLRDSI